MNNILIRLIALLLVVSVSKLCLSQEYDKSLLEQVSPTDPTSSSLGKYGVYPVNYSTGLVPITIPLYEIKSGDLSQIIELNYHGGGIRVTEEATWVGLGWDLNFGGVITRSMNGYPDELETSPVPDANTLSNSMHNNSDLTNLTYYEWLANPTSPENSFKPDLYSYNFGNYSGTFFIKNATGIYKPISIAHSAITGSIANNEISLTSPDGTTYNFVGNETTSLLGQYLTLPYISSYYIEKITSSNNTDNIRYEYQDDGSYFNDINNVSMGYKDIERNSTCNDIREIETQFVNLTTKTIHTVKVQSKKPQYIYFNGGRITLNLGDRFDINPSYPNKIKKLESIVVEKKQGESYIVIKAIKFYYSYFNNGGDYNSQRLCLDSVVESPALNTIEDEKLIASFTYYGDKTMPNKKSFSFDYWGFYNGKENASPIPYTITSELVFGDALKTPNDEFAKYGSIKEIKYPTKGKTEFLWEGNRINSPTPIYNCENYQNVSLISDNNLSCEISNSPDDDGIKSYTFHSYIDQYIVLYHYMYPEISDLTHNKYDTGSIKINNIPILTSLNTGTSTRQMIYYLHANEDCTVKIKTNCSNIKAAVWFKYNSYNPAIDANNYPFAGIRIKEIINKDTNNDILSSKKYTYLNSNGLSSGYITNNRRLSYKKEYLFVNNIGQSSGAGLCVERNRIKTHMYYSVIKTGMDANNFGYENVQEFSNTNNQTNGYTDFQFAKSEDLFIHDDLPLIPKSHTRGQLIRQSIYKGTSNNYTLTKEISNFYSKDPRVVDKTTGFGLPKFIDFDSSIASHNSYESTIYQSDIYEPHNYEYTSDWIKLDSTITKEYFQPASPVITKTSYVYGNEKHLQPTEVKTFLNGSDVKRINTIYPNDDNSTIAGDMVARNMLVLPLDIKEYILKNGSEQKLISGNKLTYSKNINDHILLTKVSLYLPNGTIEDNYEYSYNNRGRLTEVSGKDGLKTAICWDAENINPIVIGKNISYFDLSGALQAVNNNLTNLYTSNDSRLKNTQISTYSYYPLIGLQSKTDARGITTYYSYDGFGRLIETYIIENGTKKIIQNYYYNFKH